VLACGGTRLVPGKGTIQSETVWNNGTHGGATGGGVSAFFDKPEYQKQLPQSVGKRGVPDVAAVADPQTGYQVFVDGQSCVVGGTSAVAPLWASLIALCNESIGKPVGFIHPHLYGTFAESKALHDVKTGTNGAYKAGPGWDSCTGLGSPDGQAILAALRAIKPAK
jgi:kumamolisin